MMNQKSNIPSWTTSQERDCLEELAIDAKDLIVEIGALYGGTTAVMALSNPNVKILSIDNFSWSPEGYPAVSAEGMKQNLQALGIFNSEILEADSREEGKNWKEPIDFLFIDGGHSFEYVYSDLRNFGPHAQVIALHDYDNPSWPDIREAVEKFLPLHPEYQLTEVVGTVVILRRLK